MTPMKVVAFDGTPVAGAAGVRTAIIEHDGFFSTSEGRRLVRDDVMRLIADGYVTAIDPAFDITWRGGVVAYRHRDFVFPGMLLCDDDVAWCLRGEVEVAYLDADVAAKMFERHARAAWVLATAALSQRTPEEASRLARRGLMVTPRLRTSSLAARLYGVMLAAASMEGNPELIQREIGIMLDEVRAVEAARVAASALVRTRENVADARRFDRPLRVGSPDAPREAA